MNTFYKYTMFLLAAAFVFVSCSDDDDAAPVSVSGSQVYFSNELDATVELSKSESSFSIPVSRADSTHELTMPITATMPEGSIFNVPSSVYFAAGQATTDIVVTYDPAKLEYGVYTPISITLSDEANTTPFGAATYAFNAGATAWVSLGMATFREGLVGPLYGFEALTYEVEIQKSIIEPGIYQLIYPYGSVFPYNDPGDWDTSMDYNMIIDASDPDYVYIPEFQAGINWGQGFITMASAVDILAKSGSADLAALKSTKPELFGQLKDGVFCFPTPGSIYLRFNDDDWKYRVNRYGELAIALPGYSIKDYSVQASYQGRFTDVGNNNFAQVKVVYGTDVVSAKIILATEDNVEELYEKVVAGVAGEEVLNGDVAMLPFNESGEYIILVVAFDEEGNAVDSIEEYIELSMPGSEENAGQWSTLYSGDYYYGLFEESVENTLLYGDTETPGHYRLAPWGDEAMEFYMLQGGRLVVEPDKFGVSVEFEDGSTSFLYVTDVATFTNNDEKYAKYESKYEDGVFTFYMVYYNDKDTYLACDIYTIKEEAGVKKLVPAKGGSKPSRWRLARNLKKQTRLLRGFGLNLKK